MLNRRLPGACGRDTWFWLYVRADTSTRHEDFSFSFGAPGVARCRSAPRPGRKKYAPPFNVVKAGNPVIFLRIGRFGILNSSVPSW